MSEYKLAIVMRADLEMNTVKTCVQAEHASVYAFLACLGRDNGEIASKWWNEGQCKVVLQVHGLS